MNDAVHNHNNNGTCPGMVVKIMVDGSGRSSEREMPPECMYRQIRSMMTITFRKM